MNNNYSILMTKQKEFVKEDEILTMNPDQAYKLIVYNDDFNTFDWVIDSFVAVLKHSAEQAEQLSYLIHFKGKATVKNGAKKELKPLKDALVDRGLSAVIEE